MGLDIGPSGRWDEEGMTLLLPDAPTAHWSYGGFHRFRQLLAAEDGIDLEMMEGFAEMQRSGEPGHPGRPWSEVETTLAPLLNHSDCDGELTPAECTAILPRLKEIRVTWHEGDADPWDVEKLDALINVTEYCAATSRNIDFH